MKQYLPLSNIMITFLETQTLTRKIFTSCHAKFNWKIK